MVCINLINLIFLLPNQRPLIHNISLDILLFLIFLFNISFLYCPLAGLLTGSLAGSLMLLKLLVLLYSAGSLTGSLTGSITSPLFLSELYKKLMVFYLFSIN